MFRRHYPRLVGLARRVLGDHGEAEDAAQEAPLALRTDPVAERGEADGAGNPAKDREYEVELRAAGRRRVWR